MMGVLFCCGAGFFIRRRMYPSVLSDEPAFNVSFTRQAVATPGNHRAKGQGHDRNHAGSGLGLRPWPIPCMVRVITLQGEGYDPNPKHAGYGPGS